MKTAEELSVIKVNISQCYDALRDSLTALSHSIRNDYDYPIWMANTDQNNARRSAIEGIESLFAAPGQSPNQTVNCLGVVGASSETLSRIAEVNEKKLAFKESMSPLSKQQRMAPDPDNPEQMISTPLARIVLREMKLGTLLQRQATRQIVTLNCIPFRIGFTMTARSPSVVRITKDQARNRLIRLGDDYSIKQQLFMLEKLDDKEMLAVVISIPRHVRQNITYLGSSGKKQNTQKKTSLPLFYPCHPGEPLPIITMCDSNINKRLRANCEIENDPYLPAIHAYRYKPTYRDEKALKEKFCSEIQ